MIDGADGILPYVRSVFVKGAAPAPSSFDTDVRNSNWGKVLLRLEGEWEPVLSGPAVAIPAEQLTLPDAASPSE